MTNCAPLPSQIACQHGQGPCLDWSKQTLDENEIYVRTGIALYRRSRVPKVRAQCNPGAKKPSESEALELCRPTTPSNWLHWRFLLRLESSMTKKPILHAQHRQHRHICSAVLSHTAPHRTLHTLNACRHFFHIVHTDRRVLGRRAPTGPRWRARSANSCARPTNASSQMTSARCAAAEAFETTVPVA